MRVTGDSHDALTDQSKTPVLQQGHDPSLASHLSTLLGFVLGFHNQRGTAVGKLSPSMGVWREMDMVKLSQSLMLSLPQWPTMGI